MYRVYNFTGTTEQLVFKSNDKCYVHFICIVLREYCLCFQFIFHRPVSTVPSNCQCLSSKITFQLVNIVLAWFFYCIIEWLGESTGIYWEKEWRLYITKYKLQNIPSAAWPSSKKKSPEWWKEAGLEVNRPCWVFPLCRASPETQGAADPAGTKHLR
jgi:hypothetical protein